MNLPGPRPGPDDQSGPIRGSMPGIFRLKSEPGNCWTFDIWNQVANVAVFDTQLISGRRNL